MESLFLLNNTTKAYDGEEVLSVSELAFEPRKIYAVLGPNGSGKTTLLRLLNLLDRPTSGSLRFRGSETSGLSETELLAMRRHMCMVLQHTHMFNTSVHENVAYPLRLRGVSGHRLQMETEEALKMVGLQEFSARSATTLSGGEAQRVALARALALRPSVLLLDEPTANLDPSSVAAIENVVAAIHDECGSTVIMVTHNLFQARRLAHEVVFLYQGRVIEQNPTDIMFQRPENELTRQFMAGTMVY